MLQFKVYSRPSGAIIASTRYLKDALMIAESISGDIKYKGKVVWREGMEVFLSAGDRSRAICWAEYRMTRDFRFFRSTPMPDGYCESG